MARSVRYHPSFDFDIVAAARWYDERQEDLGSDFVIRVRNATSQLIGDPGRRTTVDYGTALLAR